MKKLVLATLLAMSSCSAQAVVYMTDNSVVVYDPNETYVMSGQLGPAPTGTDLFYNMFPGPGSYPERISSFNFGFSFIDPSHRATITLTAPDDLIGELHAGTAANIYGGLVFISIHGWSLYAGESITFTMGGFLQSSPLKPITMIFGLVAPDMPYLIEFGPSAPGGNLVTAVPEPSAVFMLLAGLGLVGFVARRRQPETAGV